mmetsp:Transcript_21159/g.42579  ORF Transcript_21159/g.42579 Transcript_21159/m.42579 type:complete len:91 (+) Transcript_21159:1296-1568(+)
MWVTINTATDRPAVVVHKGHRIWEVGLECQTTAWAWIMERDMSHISAWAGYTITCTVVYINVEAFTSVETITRNERSVYLHEIGISATVP